MALLQSSAGQRQPQNQAAMMFLILALVFASIIRCQTLGDTLLANEQIVNGGSLISAKGTFELGFFSPENQTTRYLGIWYRNMNTQTIVWVANRANPITTKNSSMILTSDGTLSLRDGTGTVVWSTGTKITKNPQAHLLDTGNFVVTDNTTGSLLWQSFDYPSDTLLPDMRLGYDLQINQERYITSWKSPEDPAPGSYTYKMDPKRLPELLLFTETTLKFRTGTWNGKGFNGVPAMKVTQDLVYYLIWFQNSTYYWYDNGDSSVLWRSVVGYDGLVHQYYNSSGDWIEFNHSPRDYCDNYGFCGPSGLCTIGVCSCLTESYSPKSMTNWNLRKYSDGCVRNEPLNCTRDNGFIKMSNVKLPDTKYATARNTSRMDECKSLCLKSCSCTAFAFLGGTECVTWQGELVDLVNFPGSGDDFYLRTNGSDSSGEMKKHSNATTIAILVASSVAVVILIVFFVICYCRRRPAIRSPLPPPSPDCEIIEDQPRGLGLFVDPEAFDIRTLRAATNNFNDNKLGEGCFGPVYKATLEGGRVIAVKRLAKDACRGLKQFLNEVNLLANLSHRNLVQLLGYCIDDKERILCYEYMPNGSLDKYLADHSISLSKSEMHSKFDWKTRSRIVEEISCGVLYLHEECGQKIVHRDIKPGNILLDENMIPKISDFGFAKLCRKDQRSTYTAVLIGTKGYMAPEMLGGTVSTKADIFSFGVIIMEIVTGRLSTSFPTGIVNHVAKYWMANKELELIDPKIKENANKEELVRFIVIALLCVQQDQDKRPEMRNINVMLNSKTTLLPQVPRVLSVDWGISFDAPQRF
ncbi:hypothetical protein LUZ60_010638 [Juncus effusus]|nr:hypothetical protein LUZ60_010638 [Juncus effusus]